MRITALVVVLLASCERAGSGDHGWWCFTDELGLCHASRQACELARSVLHPQGSCERRDTAFCVEDGCYMRGVLKCEPECTANREACGVIEEKKHGRCQESAPPAHPERWPDYVEPGWWCWQAGVTGREVSACYKYRPECDWALDDTLAKAGLTHDAALARGLAHACQRPDGPVSCFSFGTVLGKAYNCFLSLPTCELARGQRELLRSGSGSAVMRGEISACAPWIYD
jgi:hypothetical protein